MTDDALTLTRELITRRSLTPDDAGCQALIAEKLEHAGFTCHHLRFRGVDNLWAVAGDDDGPLFCFAGHTDVVPPGDAAAWRHGPFEAVIDNDRLYGRGAADMKSGVAAMVTAACRFRMENPKHRGRIALLLTSDEEGPAIDGTRAVIDWLSQHDTQIDYCLIGEPTADQILGDTIKTGRRGSLNAHITVDGHQGHVAYPQTADNALHRLISLLNELVETTWDDGDELFPPTSFQASNITAGTGAENVIPGRASANCNWRFNTAWSAAALREYVAQLCKARHIDPDGIEWRTSGEPFATRTGALVEATKTAVHGHTGLHPTLSTGGGTSDARYIAPTGAETVEIGPVNATIHQLDEHIAGSDPAQLAAIYNDVLSALLAE
ncbi:succinyl-diaminopimelate desuccinylase [Salinisphaera orenii]|uniref:succinyl-diaminopimelate desuccinylase n=1 Tax=Salinisphaera orenii TaxID=856731 RepID=UPI000DBE2AA0